MQSEKLIQSLIEQTRLIIIQAEKLKFASAELERKSGIVEYFGMFGTFKFVW